MHSSRPSSFINGGAGSQRDPLSDAYHGLGAFRPLACPKVRIEALSASFYVDGKTVEVGKAYDVPIDIAESLVAIGKARRMAWEE